MEIILLLFDSYAMVQYAVFVLLLIMTLLSVYLYYIYSRSSNQLNEVRKVYSELKEENSRLEEESQHKALISNLGAIEAERRKIGADLHDFMGSMLWAAKVQLGLATRKGNLNDQGIEAVNKATEIIDETMQNTKLVIQRLVPKTLIKIGLSEAILEHCERISSDRMKVFFEEHGEPFFKGSNDNKLIILFRIVQELLNNCVKYSEATTVYVTLNWGARLIISIVNNGRPFQIDEVKDKTSNGLGTLTILERVSLLKGELTSEAGLPNTLVLEIPYK